MYKVCKFGGSSLSTAEEWKKIKAIIDSDNDRRIVVVSAIGKADKKDNKVTDLLYLIYQHHKYHVDYLPLFEEVKNKYLQIKKELNINIDIEEDFDDIKERLDENRISEVRKADGKLSGIRLRGFHGAHQFRLQRKGGRAGDHRVYRESRLCPRVHGRSRILWILSELQDLSVLKRRI